MLDLGHLRSLGSGDIQRQQLEQRQDVKVGGDLGGRSVQRGGTPQFRRPDPTWRNFVQNTQKPLGERSVTYRDLGDKPPTNKLEALDREFSEFASMFGAEDFDPAIGQPPPDLKEQPSGELSHKPSVLSSPGFDERSYFPNDKSLVDVTDSYVQKSIDLLSSTPGPGDFRAYVKELRNAAGQLQEFRTSLGKAAGNLSPRALKAAATELDRQIAGLQRRAAYLENVAGNAPVSAKTVARGMSLRADAAMTAILNRAKQGGLSKGQDEILRQAYNKISDLKLEFTNSPKWQDGTTTLNDVEKLFKANDPSKILEKAFDDAGLPGGKKAFDRAFLDKLNSQDWDVISETVEFTDGDSDVALTSTITPGGQMGNVFDSYGGHGFASHAGDEVEHATNLARSEMHDADGKELFSGFRHGIHSAYEITAEHLRGLSKGEFKELMGKLWPSLAEENVDRMYGLVKGHMGTAKELAAELRSRANLNRATEVVQAKIATDADMLKKALSGEEIHVNLTSISLVTPDTHRGGPEPKHDNERLMLEEQTAAYRKLSGPPQPKEIEMKGPDGNMVKVKVHVRINTFNFGVNAGAFIPIARNKAGGWDKSTEMNRQAMADFLGDTSVKKGERWRPGGQVGDFIREQGAQLSVLNKEILELTQAKEKLEKLDDQGVGSLDQKIQRGDKIQELAVKIAQLEKQEAALQHTVDTARDLADQIREMWNSESYMNSGNEPYKMVSRLAVLAHLIGDTPVWNCKSGKDRTGQLDVEAKFLAWQISAHKKVPAPNRKRPPQEQGQLFQMVAKSGNLKMQERNTAFPGFKLKGVDAIQEQLGGPGAKVWHRGLSDQVKT